MKMCHKHALYQIIHHNCFIFEFNVFWDGQDLIGFWNRYLQGHRSLSVRLPVWFLMPYRILMTLGILVDYQTVCHDYCWNLIFKVKVTGAGDPGQWWRHVFLKKKM